MQTQGASVLHSEYMYQLFVIIHVNHTALGRVGSELGQDSICIAFV